MDFLADIWVTCPVCEGHRFNRETLQVRFKGKSIADVLEMDVQQALEHFENIPHVRHSCKRCTTWGSITSSSASHRPPSPAARPSGSSSPANWSRRAPAGRSICSMSRRPACTSPTSSMLLKVLHGFVDAGNTVLVVEHNLDVVKTADWIIDLGPEGGRGGGQHRRRRHARGGRRLRGFATPAEALAAVLARQIGAAEGRRPTAESSLGPPLARCARAGHGASRSQGARQHNLKGIDVEIPRDQMTVCCGLSGTGKSSLAMDTIYAEGQRRYVESLSAYARQFVDQMQKPRSITSAGLSPAIAIEQKNMGHTPRSTVGTVTEIYDYLRILFARLGQAALPRLRSARSARKPPTRSSTRSCSMPAGTKLYLMAPAEVDVGESTNRCGTTRAPAAIVRVRIDGQTHRSGRAAEIDRRRKHRVEVVVDRIIVRPDGARASPTASKRHSPWARGCCTSRWSTTTCRKRNGRRRSTASTSPATGAAAVSSRSRRTVSRSTARWAGARPAKGWGPNMGRTRRLCSRSEAEPGRRRPSACGPISAEPARSRDARRPCWPAPGMPLDVPFDKLERPTQRRIVLYGTGEQWIECRIPSAGKRAAPLFRFQYKGLYPALEEASRLSPGFAAASGDTCRRSRVFRLRRQPACAMTPRPCAFAAGRSTSSAACRWRDLVEWFNALEARRPPSGRSRASLLREVRNRLSFLVDVGLDYLTLGRARADALRRRNAAHSPGQPGRQRADRRALRAR